MLMARMRMGRGGFATLLVAAAATCGAAESSWVELLGGNDLAAWRGPVGEWFIAGDASLDPNDEKLLAGKPGAGVAINGKTGRTVDILSVVEHGDCEAHLEFMVPKGSNSGVYFMGRYEIQVFDSWGKETPTYSDCGGIYERWKDDKGYEGKPPRVNASRRPGEWQSFDVIFQAPRFDANGAKTANARFVKVVHNGVVVHEDVEVTGSTRAARFEDEKPVGPLMLQGDHGPVAYRAVRLRMRAASPAELVPDATLRAIAAYEQGKSRAELTALAQAIRTVPREALPGIEGRLLGILRSPEATIDGKRFVCRILRTIGSAEAVPALSELLPDEKLSHMARFALQHLPAPQAGEALRAALGKLEGKLEIGVVGSIGERRDRAAVPALARLAERDDAALAAAAIGALGRIGGGEAAAALAAVRVASKLAEGRDDALLLCADSLVAAGENEGAAKIYRELSGSSHTAMIRLAARRGLVMADREKAAPIVVSLLEDDEKITREFGLGLVAEIPGEALTKALAAELTKLEARSQRALLSALAARGDPAASGAIAELAAKGSDAATKKAALRALGTLGGAAAVEPLVALAAGGGEAAEEARASLARLRDGGARAKLMAIASGKDAAARAEALRSLEAIATEKELPELVALFVASPEGSDPDPVLAAIGAVAGRARDRDAAAAAVGTGIAVSGTETKVKLLALMPRMVGREALKIVRTNLASTDPQVKGAAERAILEWPAPDALPDVCTLAKASSDPAARGAARAAALRLLAARPDAAPSEIAARFGELMASAATDGEREQVIEAAAAVPALWSLNLVEKYRNDPKLGAAAARAHEKIFAALNKLTILEDESTLTAKEAKIHGSGARYEAAANRNCIGVWNSAEAWVSWDVLIRKPGTFAVEVEQSMAGDAGSAYALAIGDARLAGTVKETGDWARFTKEPLGTVTIKEPGAYTVTVKPTRKAGTYVMNLRSVVLRRK